MSAPVLRCPDFRAPFTLQFDACGYRISTVLTQKSEDGEHAISYLCKSLQKTERK